MSGTPRAVSIDIGVQWEAGAPMPHLLVGLRTFLLFYARAGGEDPAEDRIGLLEIVGCAAVATVHQMMKPWRTTPFGAMGWASTPLIRSKTRRGCLNGVSSHLLRARRLQLCRRNCATSSLPFTTKRLRFWLTTLTQKSLAGA